MTEELPKATRPYTKRDFAESMGNIIGDRELENWLVGKIMERSKGKADPDKVRQMVVAPYMQAMTSVNMGMLLDSKMREKYWGPIDMENGE